MRVLILVVFQALFLLAQAFAEGGGGGE